MPIISNQAASALGAVPSVTGTAAAGKVPVATSASAAAWTYPPGFEIGYDQITANANITGTTEGTANALISCAAHTFDGGAVVATFCSNGVRADTAAAGDNTIIALFEGASVIGWLAEIQVNSITAGLIVPVLQAIRFTPTAASHTYTVKGWSPSTTGTPTVLAGAGGSGVNAPAYVRFTKV